MWIDLEGIMLSEISQTEKDKHSFFQILSFFFRFHLHGESEKQNKLVNIFLKESDSHVEETSSYNWGQGSGERQYRSREGKDY